MKNFNISNVRKFMMKTKQIGLKNAIYLAKNKLKLNSEYKQWILLYDQISNKDRDDINNHIERLQYKPKFSIIMPVYNTPENILRKAIESVLNQLYPYWELCIADDFSNKPYIRKVLEEYKMKDSRIKVVYRSENGGISEASNDALKLATGEFIALFDHDDELSTHALYMIAADLNNHPDANIIYSDEDKIDEDGNRFDPYFKPDFNYLLFLGQNIISHFGVYRKSLVEKVGGFRKGYEGAQDWDLAIRIAEIIPESTIRHIPFILYHWRVINGSTALSIGEKPYVRQAQYKTLIDHLKRKNINADLIDINNVYWRIKLKLPDKTPKVSIVIPTKNKVNLLSRCVESILNKTNYKNYEIIIVDNGSNGYTTLEYLERISKHEKIKIIKYDIPFNYSKINNYAIHFAKGELLLFLNNDIEVINHDWLEEMVSYFSLEKVGAVGAMLYYSNNTMQHAGVILGIGGVAGHAYRFFPKGHPGQSGRAWLPQYFSAVTGACLLCSRKVFEEIGGFDENLAVAFNDIDLCLKIREKGYKIVWTPYAELYYYESATREIDEPSGPRFVSETNYMHNKWGYKLLCDPVYNPNLTLDKEDFSLAFPPRVKKPWKND